MILLGCAWQLGRVPLRRESILRAVELNGVQVEQNIRAFEWGRRAAVGNGSALPPGTAQVINLLPRVPVDQRIAKHSDFLRSYQDARYASEFTMFVEKVRAVEAAFNSTRLTEAVCASLFKLMAYKDEYEVARLYSSPEFASALSAQFEGPVKLTYHLAPPLFARRNASGKPIKRPFGAWMGTAMRVLASLRVLRGSMLDPFGYTAERRMERRLIGEYRARIEQLLSGLSPDKLSLAVQIASVPLKIRGFGYVKEQNLAAASVAWDGLMAEWRAPSQARRSAQA
jgi:indolepyruvate ferredoxin oxidoreductase